MHILNYFWWRQTSALIILRSAHPQHSGSHFVPCLPAISYCCCNMPATHWQRKITWPWARSCWSHALLCSVCLRFVSLKKYSKTLCRTHQVNGQYELLCLKWLVSELITESTSCACIWTHWVLFCFVLFCLFISFISC